ncbi:dTMP kinase [Agaribacterium haliotis]|uniref:dTMP kinase n=1 Tax=Agaribacterium haliotis TaxID=2013869 RepID=UPI0023D83191|nr:dTMP kinase [Agaribacterium haliotis]
MSKALFITVEGGEGVGKSTNMAFIASFLKARGVELKLTREPGGTALAEELRELLLKKRDEKFDETAELLTVFAARAQHLNTFIKPALAAGSWVLSDRFTDASFAYQGWGRGLSTELIEQLENLVQGSLRPDLTILLDIDPRIGLARASARAELDRFESEKVEFFDRVRRGYLARVEQEPERFAVIDASLPLVQVQADIQAVLEGLF